MHCSFIYIADILLYKKHENKLQCMKWCSQSTTCKQRCISILWKIKVFKWTFGSHLVANSVMEVWAELKHVICRLTCPGGSIWFFSLLLWVSRQRLSFFIIKWRWAKNYKVIIYTVLELACMSQKDWNKVTLFIGLTYRA